MIKLNYMGLKFLEKLKGTVIDEFWERFKKPWCISFTIFFVFYIVIIGGLGVIISFYRWICNDISFFSVAENITTYSLALAIPSAVQILLTYYKTKNKSSLIMLVPILCIMPIFFAVLIYHLNLWYISFFLLLLSWFVWVVAECDDIRLNDKTYDEQVTEHYKKLSSEWD